MSGVDDERDPFEGLTLDESFINAAARKEASAEERVARAARIDQGHRELQRQQEAERAELRKQALGRRTPKGFWIVLAVVAAIFVYALVRSGGDDRPTDRSTLSLQSDLFIYEGTRFIYPSAPEQVSTEPLGTPPPAPSSSGPHKFIATQEDGSPVTWDPCRPITLVVNESDAPRTARTLLEQAVATVSEATGLVLEIEGTTSEAADTDRVPVIERYGDRWAPVLVAWTTPDQYPGLQGDVAGLAGPFIATDPKTGTEVATSGTIVLDGPQLIAALAEAGGPARVRAVLAHELAHLVGLDHVDDPAQLMHPSSGAVTAFADGDRTGLALLGGGACHPDL